MEACCSILNKDEDRRQGGQGRTLMRGYLNGDLLNEETVI